MFSEWRVRLLRAWFGFRERLGCPYGLTKAEHERASDTVLLAGSPWVHVSPTSTATSGTSTLVITNTTWASNG